MWDNSNDTDTDKMILLFHIKGMVEQTLFKVRLAMMLGDLIIIVFQSLIVTNGYIDVVSQCLSRFKVVSGFTYSHLNRILLDFVFIPASFVGLGLYLWLFLDVRYLHAVWNTFCYHFTANVIIYKHLSGQYVYVQY